MLKLLIYSVTPKFQLTWTLMSEFAAENLNGTCQGNCVCLRKSLGLPMPRSSNHQDL